jgi:antibiotic biosynthesis monooxygenase (ABM) superfamily enzyme
MIVHQNDNNQGSNDDSPVTVIVTRKAKKGKIREFEEWMENIIFFSLSSSCKETPNFN